MVYLKKPTIAILLLMTTSIHLFAKLELGSPFTSNMVLQRSSEVAVWGWDDPGQTIQLEASWGESASVLVTDDGKWKLLLQTPPAGGPYDITIQGSTKMVLENVLSGEVWLASGQSNMDWPLAKTKDAEANIAKANFPQIRIYSVAKNPQRKPMNQIEAQWEVCTPKSVSNFSGVAYYFALKLHKKLQVPVGIIKSAYGGTRVGPWTPKGAYVGPEKVEWGRYNQSIEDRFSREMAAYGKAKKGKIPTLHRGNSYLYNGMIHPVVPFKIQGVIWYQGETNRGDGKAYGPKFVRAIKAWRDVWGYDFPFYFVQLAPYSYSKVPKRKVNSPYLLPIVREAQNEALKLSNTGVAIITDVGDLEDIHPARKNQVGDRLADLALKDTYGMSSYSTSPLYKYMVVDGNSIVVHLKNSNGLQSSNGEALNWFQVAGVDKVFHDAKVVIQEDSLIVMSPNVRNPVAVRFAWHESAEPNLVNRDNIPVCPFRTDDWEVE